VRLRLTIAPSNSKAPITNKTNNALENGGAIYWSQVEPIFTSLNFKDNWAKVYANNIGSFPAKIVSINEA
jgi:hypothetical protein